jgi:hypothetical protein
MKIVNTHVAKNCTRRCVVSVDDNGHYHVTKQELNDVLLMVPAKKQGRTKFKHIESAERAAKRWIA